MSTYAIVYTTMPSVDEAKKLARHLVKERLAACVNIHENWTSVYEWEGEILEENEAVLLVQTRVDMADKVMTDIRKHHTCDVASLYSMTVDKGDDAYMAWIDRHLL
ncbi:MAG: periplasmic divalent cation tolerance protein [Alphaproteobacteria bacterium]|jgi:periplasmic divalent cation tolerance protein